MICNKIKRSLNCFCLVSIHFSYCIAIFVVSLLQLTNQVIAQKKSDIFIVDKEVYTGNEPIEADQFNAVLFQKVLLHEIIQFRLKFGCDSVELNPLLCRPALMHAAVMSENDNISTDQGKRKLKTTGERMQYFGLVPNGYELTAKTAVKSGYEPLTYLKAAKDIVFKWYNNKKTYELLVNNTLIFCGIEAVIHPVQKKIYTSCILGGYTCFNELPDTLPAKYIFLKTPNKNLLPGVVKNCTKISNNLALLKIQKDIYTEETNIYLRTDNLRDINRLLRKKKDAIAVDIVQKSQFDCIGPNYINFQIPYRGVLTMPVTLAKINKTKTTDPATKQVIIPMGQIPAGIDNANVELNLVIIQNKQVCADFQPVVPVSFVRQPYAVPVNLVADTITINAQYEYHPAPDTVWHYFVIPFEKSKFSFIEKDIEPFVRFLENNENEILEIKISAFSSIEGESSENEILQKQRAYSVVEMLRQQQKDHLISEIITGFAWDDFKKDIADTPYKYLAGMSLEEARNEISRQNLSQKIEPVLKNHRITRAGIRTIQNIKGKNECGFVLNAFNKAVENKDLPGALAIQKYMMKKIIAQSWPPETIEKMNIPETVDFSGLLMNKIWLGISINGQNLRECSKQITRLFELNPKNDYILFNRLYCILLFENPASERDITLWQNQIESLYSATFTRQTIDALNIHFQLKFLSLADSLKISDRNAFKTNILNRIKNIINIKEEPGKNLYSLAQLFISNNDPETALKMLEPIVVKENCDEEMLFSYLSLCSYFQPAMLTNRFAGALKLAWQLNPQRYCNLFGDQGFPRQVFINKQVKADYCRFCQ